MASVQELLLAAQAKQKSSPVSDLAKLIDAASSGYTEGINLRNVQSEADLRRADIAKKLIEAQQIKEEMVAQEELRKQFQARLGVQSEQNLRTAQAGIATPKTLPTPAGKFTEKWSQDAKGNLSRTLEQVSPTDIAPPAGYRWTANKSLEAIPGGPSDLKAGEAAVAAQASQEEAKNQANTILTKINEAIPKISNWSAGKGAILSGVPGSDAYNLRSDIETVKSNLGFEALKSMKSQSKTGASGLGQLSDREMTLLTSLVANLDTKQSPSQLRQRLTEVRDKYQNVLEKLFPSASTSPKPATGRGTVVTPKTENKTAEQRYNELSGQGISESEIYKRLSKEGY